MRFQFLNVLILFLMTVGCSSLKTSSTPLFSSNPKLIFSLEKEANKEVSLSDLRKNLTLSTLQVDSHPAYGGKTKRYIGYDLQSFLKVYSPSLALEEPFWLEVTTLDGWKAPLYSSKTLLKGKALLAIRELEGSLQNPVSKDGLWSLVVASNKTLYPGPYFLVWNDKGKNPDIMPLQVATIKIYRKPPGKK